MAEAVRQELSALAAIFCGPHEWEMLSCSGEYPASHPAATAGSRGPGVTWPRAGVGGEQEWRARPALALPSPGLALRFLWALPTTTPPSSWKSGSPQIFIASYKPLSLTALRCFWLSGTGEQCQPRGRQAANSCWEWANVWILQS
ncbi:hypothetical protein NN561_020392 [Cricetulus griseus]